MFTLESGRKIGLTDEHPVEQWCVGRKDTYFEQASNLVVGDYFISQRSNVWGSSDMKESEAEFLGRMVGDGSYNLYDDSRGNREPYHKMYLSCSWEEKDECVDLLERASINYTLDETQGRHCRFWIHAIDKKGRRKKKY